MGIFTRVNSETRKSADMGKKPAVRELFTKEISKMTSSMGMGNKPIAMASQLKGIG